ncbi:MAG: hypothetical protein MI922_03690 [Bacteroidales bacterium]|nr:hypothetical protein [Bacteroidales bacterium]
MKQIVRNFSVFLMAALVITACKSGNGDGGSTAHTEHGDKPAKKSKKELSLEDKAMNTFTNSTVIVTGAMMLAFSDAFKSQAESFATIFGEETTEESLKKIDEEIAGLDNETILTLGTMRDEMKHAFDSLAKENMTVYKKLFLHEKMKEGVEITTKYELPKGFPPLSEELTEAELKRYIVKLISADGNEEDPIVKTYTELMMWFQEVGKEIENDEELKKMLSSMQ